MPKNNAESILDDLYNTNDLGWTKGKIRQQIIQTASELQLDPALALSIAHQESRFNPEATSPTGVKGLFQVTKTTGKPYGQDPNQRTDPQQSMQAGLRYFKDLLTETKGDVPQALMRYNGGSDPQYVRNVMQHYPLQRSTLGAMAAPGGGETAEGLLDKLYGAGKPAPSPQPLPGPSGMAQQPVAPRQPTIPSDLAIEIAPPAPRPPGSNPYMPPEMAYGQPVEPDVTETISPVELALTGSGASIGQRLGQAAAHRLAPLLPGMVGRLALPAVQAGATGLGLEAGYKASQAVGATPGSPTEFGMADVVNLVLPGATQALGALGRKVLTKLPGASATMHEEAARTAQGLPGRLAPARPSAELYQELAQGTNPAIPVQTLVTRAQELAQRELRLQPSLRNPAILRTAQDLQALARQHPSGVPLDLLYEHQQRLGLLLKEANRQVWPQAQGLRRLYGGIHDDIDQAAASGIPEAATLRQATQAARKEFAQEDLAAMFQTGSAGITTRPDGLVQINGGRLLDRFNKRVREDDVFARSFTPDELTEVQGMLKDMVRLPRIPPARGATYGAGATLGRSGLAFGVTQAITGDPAAAAVVGGLVGAAPSIIARAVMSSPGRALLREYIRAQQPLGVAELTALSTAIRSSVERTPPPPLPFMPPRRQAPTAREGAGTR